MNTLVLAFIGTLALLSGQRNDNGVPKDWECTKKCDDALIAQAQLCKNNPRNYYACNLTANYKNDACRNQCPPSRDGYGALDKHKLERDRRVSMG
ncbi:hypothetical protein [uncultured Sphingomonas sp.]|uniref:hypothetical protein n=1 Tax=uncultured Sphingomonas sp. TaxID=158754 RepID=UPI0025F7E811|nr:hypothetical protein [uncultured Sphingomonas sp.]